MIKAKWCWVATQTRKGWRLSLAVGDKNYNLSGLLLNSEEDVKKITRKGGIVFVELKNNKTINKARRK